MSKKVVAVIQARWDSSRLPGKILMKLVDRPIIWHVIKRLEKVKNLDDIVVATTTNKKDDKLVKYLASIGVKYFRGSEEDVLDRFVKTAEEFNADYVVRVCSECPLIDPDTITEIIHIATKNNSDYILPHHELPAPGLRLTPERWYQAWQSPHPC